MVGAHRDVHRVVEEMDELDVAGSARRRRELAGAIGPTPEGVVGDREVKVAGAELWNRLDGIGHRDAELDRRVTVAVGGDRERDDRRGGRRERGQTERPALQALERLELELGVDQAGEDRLGAVDQELPRVGEHDPLGDAPDEQHPRLGLERRDLPGDGGLRVAERVSGGGEGTLPSHLAEHSQTPRVEHYLGLYQAQQTPICIYGRFAANLRL